MKTTERLIGLTIISAVLCAAGGFGIWLDIQHGASYSLSLVLVAAGAAGIVWSVVRRIRYAKHPELKEKDTCPAKDERDMLANLKATNVVYFTLFITVLIVNLYGEYLAEFFDASLGGDTLSIIRAICLAL
ncbi:MAG: hypothetical protein Q4Q04_02270, partial [Methanocorpusculum sp.]|nr:hypothetical protein [Methanocorpusculum sp.]